MELYKREHRRYILRRMVYELFGVGGENGGAPHICGGRGEAGIRGRCEIRRGDNGGRRGQPLST